MLHGCMLRDIRQHVSEMELACTISGQVRGDADQDGPFVVVVVQDLDPANGESINAVDHFVLESSGHWIFTLIPGQYHVLGFRDESGDLQYTPGESLALLNEGRPLDCGPGGRMDGQSLVITDDDDGLDGLAITISRKRQEEMLDLDNLVSLGQVTAFGETTTLDHARFSMELARDSLWRPVDFFREGRGGVYFLDSYDPDRVPVLFVHGINGSPRVFEKLIESLDRERFQPWVYYYASGTSLDHASDLLAQIMVELEIQHSVDELHVVAHSMGGLVARSWLLKRDANNSPASVPGFISISAPWGGHSAAQLGISYSPGIVPVWYDMAPGSAFLLRLFSDDRDDDNTIVMPPETEKHLLFSYRRPDMASRDTDGVATLASMLVPQAQSEAASVRGFNDTHVGILENPEAIELINELLERL